MNDNYDCSDCARQGCIHRDAFRRLPKSKGGSGLCPGHIDSPDQQIKGIALKQEVQR